MRVQDSILRLLQLVPIDRFVFIASLRLVEDFFVLDDRARIFQSSMRNGHSSYSDRPQCTQTRQLLAVQSTQAIHGTRAAFLIISSSSWHFERVEPSGEVLRASELRLTDNLLLEGSIGAHIHTEWITALVTIRHCRCSIRVAPWRPASRVKWPRRLIKSFRQLLHEWEGVLPCATHFLLPVEERAHNPTRLPAVIVFQHVKTQWILYFS